MKKKTDVPDKFLECRNLMHAWKYTTVKPVRSKKNLLIGYEQRLQCLRCRTNKTVFLDSDGFEIKSSKYEYPEGYIVKDQGRMTVGRRASLRKRALELG